MSIIYTCRHCKQHVGQLNQKVIETSSLGLNQLSAEERKEMVCYQSNGDIRIDVICESCEKALLEHPEYHELDYFIQ